MTDIQQISVKEEPEKQKRFSISYTEEDKEEFRLDELIARVQENDAVVKMWEDESWYHKPKLSAIVRSMLKTWEAEEVKGELVISFKIVP